MPRTKQTRKKSSVAKKQKHSRVFSSNESLAQMSDTSTAVATLVSNDYECLEDFIEEFEKFYQKRKQDLKKGYEKACELVKKEISELELAEAYTEDQNIDPNKTTAPKVRQSRARKPVEKFDFKRPTTPKASRVASLTRISRSSSQKRSISVSAASIHKESFEGSTEDQNTDPNKTTASKNRRSKAASKASKPASSTRISRSSSRKRSISASAVSTHKEPFKTPMMNGRYLSGATITPKIYSNTPISVMRRPLHGEVAVSMSGSPLMVGAVSNEDVPTVNVPLHDGRVFSIMPEAGAPPIDLPEIDEETKKYLQTLRKHLAILAPSTP